MGDAVITLRNQLAELGRLAESIEAFAEAHQFPPKLTYEINLCLDELVTNIITYGYTDNLEHSIVIRLNAADGVLRLTVEDDGVPFNPLKQTDPKIDVEVDERPVGGLGIYLVRKMMDNVDYHRQENRNVVVMRKRLADGNH